MLASLAVDRHRQYTFCRNAIGESMQDLIFLHGAKGVGCADVPVKADPGAGGVDMLTPGTAGSARGHPYFRRGDGDIPAH